LTVAQSLRPQAQPAQLQPPAAQAFARELQRVERLQAQLDDMARVCQAHQTERWQALHPLQTQRRGLLRAMLDSLIPHLVDERPRLSPTQLRSLREAVCDGALQLHALGEPDMVAVHDRYSPQTLAQRQQAEADVLRERLAKMAGDEGILQAEGANPEAVWQAAAAQWREQSAQKQARRAAKAETRRQKKAPTAQQQTEQAQADADTRLRQLYRQLASALHPDRETDPQERLRKNALMGQANAAYDRKDLLALLRLQLETERVEPEHLERASQERLQSLALLLKQQAAVLERQRQAEQQRWLQALDLPASVSLKADALKQHLASELETQQRALKMAQSDLQAVQSLATLKIWLNARRPPA
jgi:hypothetical protein